MKIKDELKDTKLVRLSDIATGFDYGVGASAIPYDGKNKYIRITDINEANGKYEPGELTSPSHGLEDKYVVKKNDILLARTGASVGKSYLYNDADGILFFAGFLIRINVTNISPDYVFQYMQTEKYKKFVKVMSARSGQPGINAEEYGTLKIPVPASIEQTFKIGKLLSSIDDLIDQSSNLENLYYLKKKKYMQQIFNDTLKDTKNTKLKDVVKINYGKDYKHLGSGEVPLYGSGGNMGFVDTTISNIDAIGVGRKGTINNPFILKAPFWTVDTLFWCIPNSSYDFKYTYYLLSQVNFLKYNEGSTLPSLSSSSIYNILVRTHDVEIQKKIGEFLSLIDELISLEREQKEQYKKIKKYHLNNIFR